MARESTASKEQQNQAVMKIGLTCPFGGKEHEVLREHPEKKGVWKVRRSSPANTRRMSRPEVIDMPAEEFLGMLELNKIRYERSNPRPKKPAQPVQRRPVVTSCPDIIGMAKLSVRYSRRGMVTA